MVVYFSITICHYMYFERLYLYKQLSMPNPYKHFPSWAIATPAIGSRTAKELVHFAEIPEQNSVAFRDGRIQS